MSQNTRLLVLYGHLRGGRDGLPSVTSFQTSYTSSSSGENQEPFIFDLPELKLEFHPVNDGQSRVAQMTLNSPKTLNAISPVMLDSFNKALAKLEDSNSGARCLVLTGAGRAFCSGAMLTPAPQLRNEKNVIIEEMFPSTAAPVGDRPARPSVLETRYHPLLLRLRDLKMPILAIIGGPCVGVGMSLAMAADMIVASEDAFFLQAFRHRGLVPDGGSTYLLPRKIGWARAMELSMLGDRLGAAKALEWGLVNRVVPKNQLQDAGLDIAVKMATGPTKTLARIRELYWNTFRNTYEEQLTLEANLQKRDYISQDHKEGIKAFAEKREPVFQGK